jgi:hypothetical protein
MALWSSFDIVDVRIAEFAPVTIAGAKGKCHLVADAEPCMGLFLSRSFGTPAHLYLSSVSLFDPKAVSSSRPALRPCRRAQELSKVGRRTNRVACSALARPYLDSFEHDGTLGAVGMAIRGELAFGRGSIAPQPCIRWARGPEP